MKKLILNGIISIFVSLISISGWSQEYDFSKTMVNGLKIYQEYTYEEIIAALGQPSEFTPGEGDELASFFYIINSAIPNNIVVDTPPEVILPNPQGDEFGFYLQENGKYKFSFIAIMSSAFSVNNYVRVGDHISKVRDMGGMFKDSPPKRDGGRSTLTWVAGASQGDLIDWILYPHFYYDSNGVITSIWLAYM